MIGSRPRIPRERLVGGVCARVATRFGLNPAIVRSVAVMLTIGTAGGVALVYVALWLAIPSATAYAAAPEQHVALGTSAVPEAHSAGGNGRARSGAAQRDSAALYGPVSEDLPLVDAMLIGLADVEHAWMRRMIESTLSGGGKRMRPAIALLAGRYGDYDLNKLVPLASSVELLHTATLVHDDVIDAAAERRGKPTASALFNNASSVMLGDYLFAHAAEFVARTGNIRVIRNFAATLGTMAQGELKQDMAAFEYSEDVQRYLDRIYGKTASLFATASENGAILSGAPEEYVEPLRRYGDALGMAFQVVDDVLDFAGNADEMGKPVGSDLMAGTLTLPSILYMQRAGEDNAVRRAFEGIRRRSNLGRAIDEIRASDILEESMETARHFARLARQALDDLPEGETRATLDGLVDYVLERRT